MRNLRPPKKFRGFILLHSKKSADKVSSLTKNNKDRGPEKV
jgi:hypothetical protein